MSREQAAEAAAAAANVKQQAAAVAAAAATAAQQEVQQPGGQSPATCRIWQLREARQLYQHPLFHTARTRQRREHDGRGSAHRINVTDVDHDQPLTQGGMCGSLLRRPTPRAATS